MADLTSDIAAFDRMLPGLETEHFGDWALFHGGSFAGVYPDFESAAEEALERFTDGPYLIRQIGAGAVQFSGGMVMRPVHVHGTSGV